jgi:pyrimidine deaminase RibD-like protein
MSYEGHKFADPHAGKPPHVIDHKALMREALEEAKKSPPKPSNYCVGALLVNDDNGEVLARGYTLELEGNTHAEQCCLVKFAQAFGVSEEHVGEVLPPNSAIYTTMEPCNFRLSGNLSCVDRILRAKSKDGKLVVKKVYLGVKEPEKFVGENQGRAKLEEHGVECVHVSGMEEMILRVATAGHEK